MRGTGNWGKKYVSAGRQQILNSEEIKHLIQGKWCDCLSRLRTPTQQWEIWEEVLCEKSESYWSEKGFPAWEWPGASYHRPRSVMRAFHARGLPSIGCQGLSGVRKGTVVGRMVQCRVLQVEQMKHKEKILKETGGKVQITFNGAITDCLVFQLIRWKPEDR